ncbi:MAG: MurR/RpiR family transcriptional regulator, partial [Nocardioidaceae bacterium]
MTAARKKTSSSPMREADPLAARIRSLLPSLTPAANRVARALLEDPERVTRLSITDLAQLAEVSEATIVRTARGLGFSGYAELRLALAAAEGRRPTDRTVTGDIAVSDPTPDVVDKLAQAEVRAILDTATQVSAPTLELMADRIVAADRVEVYGVGASGLVAADLAQKLDRIGRWAHARTDAHSALTSAVLLGPTDVAIAVSHSGDTPDVVSPLRRAKAAGATTAAITNHPRSTVGRLVDHVLVSAGTETTFRPGALASRISQLLVV